MTHQTKKELMRDMSRKLLGGVASGIATYFDLDPNVVRFIFIILTIFGGSGILLYLILWIILPASNEKNGDGKETLKNNVREIKDTVQEIAQEMKPSESTSKHETKKSQYYIGLALAGVGGVLLLNNLGIIDVSMIKRFWPVLLILLGMYVVSQNE
jgi:phage shock protein PspC (stress-responsive transcriptional regulator)